MTIDVVEWMCSDVYAYFDLPSGSLEMSRMLAEALEIEIVRQKLTQAVARLGAGSLVVEGANIELSLDVRSIRLFDPHTDVGLPRASHAGG